MGKTIAFLIGVVIVMGAVTIFKHFADISWGFCATMCIIVKMVDDAVDKAWDE